MGCFGNVCATQASKQPVKRYNVLVRGIFPQHAPLIDEPLDMATIRRIGKLQEYVQENVQRVPKVSRRLARAVASDSRSARKLGNVKARSWCPRGSARNQGLVHALHGSSRPAAVTRQKLPWSSSGRAGR